MRVQSARDRTGAAFQAEVARALSEAVDPGRLLGMVRTLAVPRNMHAEPEANRRTRERLADSLSDLGFGVTIHGLAESVLAWPGWHDRGPTVLLAAHYDSVPGCPGADDNASAVAAVLAAAEAIALSELRPPLAVAFFNGEEDGLLGVLNRSDHAPFWAKGVRALMWTDTAEFRNPHYHRPTDTPETLDAGFLADVARLLFAVAATA